MGLVVFCLCMSSGMFELKETVSVREGSDVIFKRWVGDDVVKDFWHFYFCYEYFFFFFILLELEKRRTMRTVGDCWWLQIGNLIISIHEKTIYDLFFCLHFYVNNVFICLFYFNFYYILSLFVHFEQLCLHFQFVWPFLFTSSTCLLYAFWALSFSILICLLSFYSKWC